MKKSLKILAGALFAFALAFNTTIKSENEASFTSLLALETAKAQSEDDEPHNQDGHGDEYGGGYDSCGNYTCNTEDCFDYQVPYDCSYEEEGDCPQLCTRTVQRTCYETVNSCD